MCLSRVWLIHAVVAHDKGVHDKVAGDRNGHDWHIRSQDSASVHPVVRCGHRTAPAPPRADIGRPSRDGCGDPEQALAVARSMGSLKPQAVADEREADVAAGKARPIPFEEAIARLEARFQG